MTTTEEPTPGVWAVSQGGGEAEEMKLLTKAPRNFTGCIEKLSALTVMRLKWRNRKPELWTDGAFCGGGIGRRERSKLPKAVKYIMQGANPCPREGFSVQHVTHLPSGLEREKPTCGNSGAENSLGRMG